MMLKPGVTIYYVRHGETDWNAAARTQGHTDIPLNDKGRGQAALNGRRLAGIATDPSRLAYVASPLSRAQETMRIVRRELGLADEGYTVDPRLKEISFGEQDGHSWPGYVAGLMERHAREGVDPWTSAPPGGESYAMAWERSRAFFEGVDRDTVVVAHGGISRCLHAALGLADRVAAINLPIPQDRILRLEAGTAEWL